MFLHYGLDMSPMIFFDPRLYDSAVIMKPHWVFYPRSDSLVMIAYSIVVHALMHLKNGDWGLLGHTLSNEPECC